MSATLRRWYGPYGREQVWRESASLLLDLFIGIALFTAVTVLLSISAGLLVTLIGLPLLVATLQGGRLISGVERARLRALVGADLPGFAPVVWPTGMWPRVKRAVADVPGWKALAYGVLMLPWGIFAFTATVVLWSLSWSMASAPLWAWIGDRPPPFTVNGVRVKMEGWWLVGAVAAAVVLGLLLLAALPRIVHGLSRLHVAFARSLLSPDAQQQLEQRVSELEVSREASVESSASELRRIERDLHDGAQQRLVSLAMNLGLAKERLRDSDDERTREMVDTAHDEAKQAIAELRDLVRGIHPAVLTDRGLDAAVSALVARCPVPVTLQSDLPRRLPAAVEATAYFVVAEALTNVARHSEARSAMVRLFERDGHLVVEVHDDGVGGAHARPTGGLHGLTDRVAGVEGRLRIASPDGGPTVLIVELPCGS
jgi:signal transduction histidine kinase